MNFRVKGAAGLDTHGLSRSGQALHPRRICVTHFAVDLKAMNSTLTALLILLVSATYAAELPELSAKHLRALSDERGISEFAHGTVALNERFCIEDTARALVAVLKMHELKPDPETLALARLYLKVIGSLQDADGHFRFGYLNTAGRMDRIASGDNFTRVLWGLGHACHHGVDEDMRATAAAMFEKALPHLDQSSGHFMAQAYAIQGLCEYVAAKPGQTEARQTLQTACETLLRRLPNDEAWPWPSPKVTYDSARLPLAFLLAHEVTHDEKLRAAGQRLLEFLAQVNFPGDGQRLHLIGNKDWYQRGRPPSSHDQQPIDASSLVEACAAAWRISHQPPWATRCRVAFEWFMGHNSLDVPLYDAESGGCKDALGAKAANNNQGAESTLSFWIARCERSAVE